jgi:ribonuclease Z
VQPIEVQPTVSSSPEPVYKDGNITVYGISLFSSSAIEQGMHLSRPDEASLKRKRSPTPDLPSKRAITASNDNLSSDQITTPGFSPSSLSGTVAQDWRSSVLNLMFPADKKSHNLIVSGKKKEAILAKKKEKEKEKSEASVDPPKLGKW